MKQHLSIAHQGTTTGTKVRGFIDEAALGKIMSMFIDLYADPALAVIREVSTNALDSHVAAGVSDPIEVFLPNEMSPTFKVRDHGVGMSRDDIEERYIAYGYSSKDQSDDFTGMLGMGCKSPLTYSSQFTVKAVQNGRMTMVLMTRDADGCLAAEIVDESDTLDPNGVEVQVPVSRTSVFNEKARNFYRFWEPGTVLVNGKAPASIFDAKGEYEPNLLDPDVALLSTAHLRSDYVVMGNVPYPVARDHQLGKERQTRSYSYNSERKSYVVARVPIGAVNFPPSREALAYDKATLETLSDIRNWVERVEIDAAKAEVEAAADRAEAMKVAQSWRAAGVSPQFTYKGSDVPTSFPANGGISWSGSVDEPARTTDSKSMRVDTALKTFHVLGLKASRLDPTTKAKIARYLADNSIIVNRYVSATSTVVEQVRCYNFQPYEDWLPDDLKVDIETIRAIDLGKDAPVRKKVAKHRVLDQHGDTIDSDDLSEYKGKTLVVLDSYIRNPEYRSALGRYALDNDAVVVTVPPSRRVSFFKNHKCVDHTAFLKGECKRAIKACRPADVARLRGMGPRPIVGLEGVEPEQVEDPAVKVLLEELGNVAARTWDKSRYENLLGVLSIARRLRIVKVEPRLPEPPVDTWTDRVAAATEQYPHLKVDQKDYDYSTYKYVERLTVENKVEILNALHYARSVKGVIDAAQAQQYPANNETNETETTQS